jgi:hypothetical protein
MEELNKLSYVSPVARALELDVESIICASGEVPDMGHGWDLDF